MSFDLERWIRVTRLRIRSLFSARRADEELDEELRVHLEFQAQEQESSGLEEGEARRRALSTFGGVERCKDECRDTRHVQFIHDWFRDLAYAWRTLRRSPGFTAAAAATIALGIGACAAVFSVVNAVLLRPLPYRDPSRLVLVVRDNPRGAEGVGNLLYSNADYLDLQRGTAGLFEDMGGVASFRAFAPAGDGATEQLSKALVTVNFLRLMGAMVVLGRDFSEADAMPRPSPQGVLIPRGTAAILTYEYWQRRYGGDPNILGREMPGEAGGPRIVGVLAPGFRLFLPPAYRVDAAPDFYVANNGGYDTAHRNLLLAGAIARLGRGITLEQARERIRAMSPEVVKSTFDPKAVLRIESMHGRLVQEVRPAIIALMGSVIFLLLIACANVANLLMVRSSQRQRELAVRAALGGGAWRLMRQMLAESLLCSAIGTLFGIGVAWGGVRVLLRVAPPSLPRIESTTIDWRVLAFAAAAGLCAVAVFGVIPAFRALRPDVAELLRSSGGAVLPGSARLLRGAVVVAEISLSFVLLTGSGLMLRSFWELQRVDPGFDPHGLLTFSVTRDWPFTRQEGRLELLREIESHLRALPGAKTVTASLALPLTQGARADRPAAPAAAPAASSEGADFQQVLPGYFETLRTPLVAGRAFTEQDNVPGRHVVIIDQTLAARAFPNEAAIGRNIRVPFPDAPWAEVIGVVAPQRSYSLAYPGRETIYFPEGAVGIGVSRSWAIRTTGDPAAMVPAVRAALARIDSRLVMSKVAAMDTLVGRDQAGTRFALLLIGFFAAIAVLLASIGIYGVLASAVRQRTGEIAIRMALGAGPSSIFKTVAGQGLALSAAGLVIGLAAAFELTRGLKSLLVGVRSTDPATFATVTGLFLLVAAAASWLPARRAAALDPAEALRAE